MSGLTTGNSSGTPLAFSNPSSGKIDQQRKILEELERQKKLLSKGVNSQPSNNQPNNTNSVSTTSSPSTVTTPTSTTSNSASMDPANVVLTSNQRSALETANKTSFGYFIAQNSSFGNTIIPVIPRVPNK